ncbi:hypothetical protein JCM11251_004706 [Rhodosporidiobolus azoricus]
MSTSFFPTASTSNGSNSSSIYDYSRPREPYHSHSHSSYASSSSPPPHTSYSRPSVSSPTHSSASSTSSSRASRSPMFEPPPSSSHLTERGRTPVGGVASGSGGARTPRSQDGSVGSLATTVSSGVGSPGKEVVMHEEEDEEADQREDGERREAPTRDIAALSVHDEDDHGVAGSRPTDSFAPTDSTTSGGKVRRASVISTEQTQPRAAEQPASPARQQDASGGRSGRRKAARTGSFYGSDDQQQPQPAPSVSSTSTSAPATPPTVNTGPTAHHVDIVSYPSADLLRLLAALLEQIAQANDERNARNTAAPSHPPAPVPASDNPNPTTPDPSSRSRRSSVDEDNWGKGRFDAAPLNTPVTTRFKARNSKRRRQLGGEGGPGILDNALNEDADGLDCEDEDEDEEEEEAEHVDDTLPLTPGVDLLRETGDRGGVEGFMPSLGGTHRPQPLSRRRGSSFIRNKRNEDGTVPVLSRRQTSGAQGQTQAAASSSSSSSFNPSSASGSTSTGQPVRPAPQPIPTGGGSGSNSGGAPTLSSFTTYQSGTPTSTSPPLTSLLTASAIALSSPSATLCFHARNVPAISIEAYLQRILKYCPTTNEVFLALLVYFDRMARIGLEARRMGLPKERPGQGQGQGQGQGAAAGEGGAGKDGLFAIDSFNVHRLVIAGVTVASKFFSDVFYTNSRYAKVGGLPLHELNQLELQFLLLNDFRLKIPTDELQRYADQLILYWVGRNGTSNPQAAASLSRSNSVAATQRRREADTAPQPTLTPQPQPPAPQQPKTPFAPSAASVAAFPAPSPSTAASTSRPVHPSRSQPSYASSVSSSVSSSTVTPGTPSTTTSTGSSRRSGSRSRTRWGDGWDSETSGEVTPEDEGDASNARDREGEGERMDTD